MVNYLICQKIIYTTLKTPLRELMVNLLVDVLSVEQLNVQALPIPKTSVQQVNLPHPVVVFGWGVLSPVLAGTHRVQKYYYI